MEELLELIKNTEEFKRYVNLVENYSEIPTINKYRISSTYNMSDPSSIADAILENSDIRKSEGQIDIIIGNLIGKITSGEKIGSATYCVNLTKENDDIFLKGNIDARFTSFDDSMFNEKGTYTEINEQVMNENFENKFENMGHLYPSKTR